MIREVYIGNYRADGSIYKGELNTETGRLTMLRDRPRTPSPNPSYLAFSTADQRLYYVNEADESGGLCHIAVSSDGRFAAMSGYVSGTISIVSTSQPTAGRVVGEHNRGGGARAHCCFFDKSGHILSCDLGLDTVFVYDFNAETGGIGLKQAVKTPVGTGPRHLALSGDETRVFVVNELNPSAAVYGYDNGVFRGEVPTILTPPDIDRFTTGAAIKLSPDGAFVYASFRKGSGAAGDYIAAWNAEPPYDFVGAWPCGGVTPRDICVTEGFVLSANQLSDDVTVFRRDRGTGVIGDLVCSVKLEKPSCIVLGQ